MIKQALLKVPALGLPNASRPFHLYVAENRGIAKGVLPQWLGPWKHPVAYLSKKLDPVTAGWPACLWIMAAVLVLVADKLTLGQNLPVAPHPPSVSKPNKLKVHPGLSFNTMKLQFVIETSEEAVDAVHPTTTQGRNFSNSYVITFSLKLSRKRGTLGGHAASPGP